MCHQIFQPEWIATDPPMIGSTFVRTKARVGDHALERRHVGEAADRFDQIAIAVGILRQQLASLGTNLCE